MASIKVSVLDKYTLVLQEDAIKGDTIDLRDIEKYDSSILEAIILKGSDEVYNKKLYEYKKTLDLENEKKISDLNNKIEELKKENEYNLKNKENELDKKYISEIDKLKAELANIKDLNKKDKEIEINNLKSEYDAKIKDLDNKLSHQKELSDNKLELELQKQKSLYEDKIKELNNNIDLDKLKHINELDNIKNKYDLEKRDEITSLKEELNNIIKEKEDIINQLQRQKASLNVKQTGEDLEAWCDNAVKEAMQNGFLNCTWEKDNEVVKDAGELKGSKADYLFRIYTNELHNKEEEIASICMDMKDENPDSVNKKSNSDYYKQLDKNRMKKNCKYALLVSNLEMDKPNVIPIYKVREYNDMYVVRPAYLITFLNMITSLATKYSALILNKAKEDLELKDKKDILDDFSKIKETYLDKPLESLKKDLDNIIKNNDVIVKAAKAISDSCDHITISYINKIIDKIDNFEIKIKRDIKKIDKLES